MALYHLLLLPGELMNSTKYSEAMHHTYTCIVMQYIINCYQRMNFNVCQFRFHCCMQLLFCRYKLLKLYKIVTLATSTEYNYTVIELTSEQRTQALDVDKACGGASIKFQYTIVLRSCSRLSPYPTLTMLFTPMQYSIPTLP